MDIIDQLGLAERGTYARGGGYEGPPMAALNIQPAGVSGAATAAIQSQPLDAARTLARLPGGSAPLGGRRGNIQGALGGHTMMKTPPSNKAAAVLDGLMGGFADSEKSRNASAKAADDQLKQRFSMLKDLFGMDRQIAGDKRQAANDTFNQSRQTANDTFNQGAKTKELDLSEKRANAYSDYLKGGGNKKSPKDELEIRKAIDGLVANHESDKLLQADADRPRSQRMSPERRAELEAQRSAFRRELEAKHLPKPGADAEAAPAEPALTPGSVSGTPEPAALKPMAQGGMGPDEPLGPTAPPNLQDQILAAARQHIAAGAPREAVEAKMRDVYGLDPALLSME